jgi:steroid delta-isomerase-like uncharacterized protein
MSVEANKAVVQRFVDEVLNQGNVAAIDELLTPDFVEHEELPPGVPAGREATKAMFGMVHSAFPDFKVTVKHLFGEGDRVTLHMVWTGTQEGEFMGIPASGRRISLEVIDIIGMADGRMAEHWGVMDNMAMMQQLGVVPPPEEG